MIRNRQYMHHGFQASLERYNAIKAITYLTERG